MFEGSVSRLFLEGLDVLCSALTRSVACGSWRALARRVPSMTRRLSWLDDGIDCDRGRQWANAHARSPVTGQEAALVASVGQDQVKWGSAIKLSGIFGGIDPRAADHKARDTTNWVLGVAGADLRSVSILGRRKGPGLGALLREGPGEAFRRRLGTNLTKRG